MKCYDVFNGDADGIISLQQLRLAEPRDAELITGVKRDVKLLKKIKDSHNSQMTVLDISLDSNIEELHQCLENKAKILWFDHHRADQLPIHQGLEAKIDISPEKCTAIIVDEYLHGRYRNWCIAAAFGDNLHLQAKELAGSMEESNLIKLKELGEIINYNGYGEKIEDLVASPYEVVLDMKNFESPFDYYENSQVFARIKEQKLKDEKEMGKSEELYSSDIGRCVLLPESPASVRMSGIYSNELVYGAPDKAHAILTRLGGKEGLYRISIRAPLNTPKGADELALRYPGGGGRAKAAGINELPEGELDHFFKDFNEVFSC